MLFAAIVMTVCTTALEMPYGPDEYICTPPQLLEWELLLALHEAGRISKVYPILLGKQTSDGTRTEFFDDGSDGGAPIFGSIMIA
eukprot:COSAG01_NODE_2750_length_7146_cov_288.987578_7_plen_85_part_00